MNILVFMKKVKIEKAGKGRVFYNRVLEEICRYVREKEKLCYLIKVSVLKFEIFIF